MWLTVHEPDSPERRVEVRAGAFSVGRGSDCDLVLADQEASRRHALIEGRPDGGFTLRDLASTNGTAVNGRRIGETVDLHDGERITIGRTTLTVAEVDGSPAAAAHLAAAPDRLEPAPPPPRRRSRRTILLAAAGAIVVLVVIALGVAQLVLPGVATNSLRDSLKGHGDIQSVTVSAFPAVTLLWHHADKVTVRMSSYSDSPTTPAATGGGNASGQPRSGPQRLADFLASTSATDSLDARVGRLKAGRLALDSVVLTKSGPELSGSAYASYGSIRAALPSYITIRSFAAGGGELLFNGAATLLGIHANVRLRLLAHNGSLVVQPDLGPFLPSVLSLTVFKDPRVYVESVAATPAVGGFNVSARARLTGK